ncbi:MAG: class I SAM-dependent methyltransferase [Actinomycetota bacterium]
MAGVRLAWDSQGTAMGECVIDAFLPGFFDRADPAPDERFYSLARLVTHIDAAAVTAVGALYAEMGITGEVLDLMASWVSHFRVPPRRLTVLGLNADELAANVQASEAVVHDLNAHPTLPMAAESFDAAVCCVSVDYLVRPVEVFAEVRRVLRPGGPFVCTYSNRCFPTKAIRGWLETGDEQHGAIVSEYFRLAGGFEPAVVERRTPVGHPGDPLWAVWSRRR